jgi:hypothetical protein
MHVSADNPELHQLFTVTRQGWPGDSQICQIAYRHTLTKIMDSLTIQDEMVFKGHLLVVSVSCEGVCPLHLLGGTNSNVKITNGCDACHPHWHGRMLTLSLQENYCS